MRYRKSVASKARAGALLAGFGLGASTAALAYQPLLTDDTGTQARGQGQFETAFEHSRAEQAGLATTDRNLPFTLTGGLLDALDVFVGVSRVSIDARPSRRAASGFGNWGLGFKWRFYESESGATSLALKPNYLFPTSPAKEAAGLGNGRASYGVTAILTQETAFGAVHANLLQAATRYRDANVNPDVSLVQASVAPVWQLGAEWKLAVDLGTRLLRTGGSSVRGRLAEIGIVYSPNKDCDLALGAIRRSDAVQTAANTLTAGVTWRFR